MTWLEILLICALVAMTGLVGFVWWLANDLIASIPIFNGRTKK